MANVNAKKTQRERLIDRYRKEIDKALAEHDCTHYPGYTCDRDFPAACEACWASWLLRSSKERALEEMQTYE